MSDSRGVQSDEPTAMPASTHAPESDTTEPTPPTADELLSGRGILLAWAVSVAGHVTAFVILFMVPWMTGMVGSPEELPIARTELASPFGRRSPTLANVVRPEVVPQTHMLRDAVSPLAPRTFEMISDVAGAMMSDVPGVRRTELSILGIGTGGGESSKFGLQVDLGQSGPTFFGIGGQARGARRIVYIVDRSGSMIDTIFAVKKELKRSIGALRRSQRFHVIFYNAGEPLENPPKKLVTAAAAQKEEVFRFIDCVDAQDGTNPLQAVQRAFEVKPDLVYFLSDGEIPVANELLLLLESLNKEPRKVRIFTIAYVNPQGAELLEKIARTHNGEFRYVREDELFQ